MHEPAPPPPNERLLALLALATQEPRPADICPTDADLALFMDGKLAGPARQTMLTHLNHCQVCYRLWLEAAAAMDATPNPVTASAKTRPGIWQRLQPWLTWKLAIPAVAIAVFAGLVMLQPVTLDLNQRISADYANIIAQNPSKLAAIAASLPESGGTTAFGFSDSSAHPSARAFTAGVWQGKQALVPTPATLPEGLSPPATTWEQTAWVDYYAFGRWTVLTWVITGSEGLIWDWTGLQKTLEELMVRFRRRPREEEKAELAVNALNKLQALLTLAQTDKRARANLRRQLEITIQQLAP